MESICYRENIPQKTDICRFLKIWNNSQYRNYKTKQKGAFPKKIWKVYLSQSTFLKWSRTQILKSYPSFCSWKIGLSNEVARF